MLLGDKKGNLLFYIYSTLRQAGVPAGGSGLFGLKVQAGKVLETPDWFVWIRNCHRHRLGVGRQELLGFFSFSAGRSL